MIKLAKCLVPITGLLALTSSGNIVAQSSAPICQAISISCPIQGGCGAAVRGSAFGQRTDPFTGTVEQHWGTDFRIPTGTNILAAANGVVERSYLSTSYGNAIIIRHDNGSATLYAHLDSRSVQVGTPANPVRVTVGQVIGVSDGDRGAPGAGRSTGAHLHLEYVPNGAIIQSPSRIDPVPCIGNVNGSIKVFDNGNVADDAFRVTLDGVVLGETAIGQANNFAANNLIPGKHNLTVTTIIAPDNVGTYQIDLSSGLTFGDGTTSRSGTTAQGGVVTFEIVVPAPT